MGLRPPVCGTQNNTAAQGGAIASLVSTAAVYNTVFSDNTAAAAAGSGAHLFSGGGEVTLGIGNVFQPAHDAMQISR